MKTTFRIQPLSIIPFCLPLLSIPTSLQAGVLLLEDFETDGDGIRYTATGNFTDTDDDYFTRTDGLGDPAGLPAYTGFSGWFWAAEDTDAPENTAGATYLDFSGILLAGAPAIQFSLDIASGSNSAFDSVDDFMLVQYRIDTGAWQTALAFQNNGQTFNGPLLVDGDFDGIGDGLEIGLAMQTITSAIIPVSGQFLDLRIDMLFNSAAEAVAFDNVTLMSVPEPATTALAFAVASMLLLLTRSFLLRRENESRT